MSRDEKARLTRNNILNAGCSVVASEGYAAASIAKIAEMAGVAHGTFYNYFEDRQALFDELLPYEGLRMLNRIEEATRPTEPGMKRELARFEAFLNYVIENEGFYRVLYEAEIFAPVAHRVHMENIVGGYRGTVRRLITAGKMKDLDERQIDSLVYQLVGMRAYAAMQINFASNWHEKCAIRDASVEIYRLLMRGSLLADTASG